MDVIGQIGNNFLEFSDMYAFYHGSRPIDGLITEHCIHQGFRRKVTVDVIGQIGNNFREFSDMYAFYHGSRSVGQIRHICLLEKNFGKPRLSTIVFPVEEISNKIF